MSGIFKTSVASLTKSGLNIVDAEAIVHLLNKVGNTANGPSLPRVALQAGSLTDQIVILDEQAAILEARTAVIELTPVQQVAATLEHIQAEVRQIAEEVARIHSLINDLKQGIYP